MPIHVSTAPTAAPPQVVDMHYSDADETTSNRVAELWISPLGTTASTRYYQHGLHLVLLSSGTVYVLNANGSIDHSFAVGSTAQSIAYANQYIYVLASSAGPINAYSLAGVEDASRRINLPTTSLDYMDISFASVFFITLGARNRIYRYRLNGSYIDGFEYIRTSSNRTPTPPAAVSDKLIYGVWNGVLYRIIYNISRRVWSGSIRLRSFALTPPNLAYHDGGLYYAHSVGGKLRVSCYDLSSGTTAKLYDVDNRITNTPRSITALF